MFNFVKSYIAENAGPQWLFKSYGSIVEIEYQLFNLFIV